MLLLSGCGTVGASNQWRNDALQRLNTAISAGADVYAPEETDNIRQTISLADRYCRHELLEDADRLYQLSSQKSQLLYRNLVMSKVAGGATFTFEDEPGQQAEEDEIYRGHVGLDETLRKLQAADSEALIGAALPVEVDKSHQSRRSDPFSRSADHKSTPQAHVRPVPDTVKINHRHADPDKTTIYLTFDDGPSRLTRPIASFLRSEGVKATFFVLGSNIKGREKAVTDMIAMGHRVGNHTLSHNLQKLRASFASESSEIQRAGAMIERLGGDGRMVRIPYGASGKSIVSNVAAEGAQIFEWDINSKDSTRRGARNHLFIERTVLNQLNKSSKKQVILLFHDGAGHGSTLTALRDLIPRLKREGYRFGLLTRSEKLARSTESRQTVQ